MKLPHQISTSIAADGKIVVQAAGTNVTYRRPQFNAILIELSGIETQHISKLFFDLLDKELAYDQRQRPRAAVGPSVSLFVDAGQVMQHGMMFEAWIRFLILRGQKINEIHILTSNRVTQLSAEIISHLSGISSRIHLHETKTSFDARMAEYVPPSIPAAQLQTTISRLRQHLKALMAWQHNWPGNNNTAQGSPAND